MTVSTTPPLAAPSLEMEKLLTFCRQWEEESASTEAFGDFVAKRAPRISSLMSDLFRGLTTWDYARPEVLNVSAVRGKLTKVNYMDMDKITFPVPMGFQGTYPDYLANLRDHQLPAFLSIERSVFTPVLKLLSSLVQDPIQLSELARPVGWLSAKRAELDTLSKKEATFLQEGNRRDEMAYMNLFPNNNATVETMTVANEVNEARWRHASPKAIAKLTQELSTVTQALTDTLERQDAVPNRQRMSQLIEVVELTARWVEWYSVMSTRLINVTAALKTGEKKLLRVL